MSEPNPKSLSESDPLLPQSGPSTSAPPQRPPLPDRPKTVRHHRRTLSGRSVRSGHFQFGPSFHPNIYPAVNDPFTRQAQRAADNRARSRFLKALFLGVGLWIVIGLVLGWTGWQESGGWGKNNNRLNYGAKPIIPKSEGEVINCANFTSTTSTGIQTHLSGNTLRSRSYLRFHRGISKRNFFVHSKGSFAKGKITLDVIKDENLKGGDGLVEVEIEALYNDEALIDLMNVCQVDRRGEDIHQAGLVIYTPSPDVGPYPESDLEFRITIRLPKTLDSLEIRSSLFTVNALDLSDLVKITRLDIGTTVGSVNVENLKCHAVRIRTENGHVDGSFNVSKTLSLASTNGAITAQVGLFPLEKSDEDLPDLPPNPPSRGGSSSSSNSSSTSVHATTTNGAVIVKFVHHPVDQTLLSFVSSTNGKASVEHQPAFEGNFEAETVWGSAVVKGPLSDQDPKGLERIRKKIVRTDRDELGYRHISGSVWWADEGGDQDVGDGLSGGSVVKTTLGSALIIFN